MPVNCSSSGGQSTCTGGNTLEFGHETTDITITADGKTYFASRTINWRWQRSPRLTENSRVKFALEKDTLYLLDDDGREFKMSVGKRRNESPADRLEECRTTMAEFHAAYPGLEAVNAWASALSPADLLESYTYDTGCAAQSIELRDMPMVSQFEIVRAEILLARAAKDAQLPDGESHISLEECGNVSAKVEGLIPKDIPAPELSQLAKNLYVCALDEFKSNPSTWFLTTAKARAALLTEVIHRQTRLPVTAQPSAPK